MRVANGFTFFFGKQDPFSNWHPATFTYNNVDFVNTEQFMMYCKARLFKDEKVAAKILAERSPKEHKALGREVSNFDKKLWEEKCEHYVYVGCREKFKQNPELLKALFATEGTILVEASPYDRIWGIGLSANHKDACNPEKWRGQNRLGKVLTRLRDDLLMELKPKKLINSAKVKDFRK